MINNNCFNFFQIAVLIGILILIGCNNPENKGNSTAAITDTSKIEKQAMDAILLQGIYATSTAIPYLDNAPHNVVDGTDKAWITMNGAGPDEGLMMYFDNSEKINSMKVKFHTDKKYAEIEFIQVYINGSEYGYITPKNNVLKIESNNFDKINSIYFRIGDVEGIKKLVIKDENQSNIGQIAKFAANKAVGIKEIIFNDAAGKQLKVLAPSLVQGNVVASSVLEPAEAYNPDFLFDARLDFGWAEGNVNSNGVGEALKFDFLSDISIEKIKIWNGFQRSDEHFTANGRVKSFDFGTASFTAQYNIPDNKEPVVVELKQSLHGKSFNFKVNEIYSGTKYKDLVVSELSFYGNNSWFTLFSGNYDKRKSELMDKVSGSILEKVINRYFNEQSDEPNFREVSLLLRSNQSFVIWESEGNEPDAVNFILKVYDGNWQLVSYNNTEAKVKIFGKRRIINTTYNPYKAKAPTDNTFIFSDFLTITKNAITGEKFFNYMQIDLDN